MEEVVVLPSRPGIEEFYLYPPLFKGLFCLDELSFPTTWAPKSSRKE
jgi:hypothetical protein